MRVSPAGINAADAHLIYWHDKMSKSNAARLALGLQTCQLDDIRACAAPRLCVVSSTYAVVLPM